MEREALVKGPALHYLDSELEQEPEQDTVFRRQADFSFCILLNQQEPYTHFELLPSKLHCPGAKVDHRAAATCYLQSLSAYYPLEGSHF